MSACPHFPFVDRPGVSLDPEYLRRYRDRPLVPVQLSNGREALLVTRYADVRTVLSDPRFSRQAWAGGTLFARDTKALALVTSDPPLHTRRRRTVQSAFTPHQAELDRARIEAFAEALLDEVERLPSPTDLVAAFTKPFPYGVICDMLGLDRADVATYHPWVDVMMSAGRFGPDAVAEAHKNMYGYFHEQLQRKQANIDAGEPTQDLLTRLLMMPEEERLSLEEITVLAFGMMMAGGETTMNHLAMCVYQVVRDPALADALRRDPQKIPAAVEELLRWVWFAGTGGQPHVALEPVELEGGTIDAGQVVIPLTDAANRDPEVFGDADTFRIDRGSNRHVGFGLGRHMCLGAPHARVELQVGLAALLRRFGHLELAVPEEDIAWRSNMFIRGVWTLPVRFRR